MRIVKFIVIIINYKYPVHVWPKHVTGVKLFIDYFNNNNTVGTMSSIVISRAWSQNSTSFSPSLGLGLQTSLLIRLLN